MKDESQPARANYKISSNTFDPASLKSSVEKIEPGEKNLDVPRVGHKLHRLTTMTSKTQQFHLLANGNPKPENLLVSPLAQFELDGSPRADFAEAAAVGVADRSSSSR